MSIQTKSRLSWGVSAWTGTAALGDHFRRVRDFTLALCGPLTIEDHVAQSMPDASPAKWHLAHTTWFFEQFVLTPFAKGYRPFHPDFAFQFNSYYNAAGDRVARPSRGLMTRPSVQEVRRYGVHVDQAIPTLLGEAGETGGQVGTLGSP